MNKIFPLLVITLSSVLRAQDDGLTKRCFEHIFIGFVVGAGCEAFTENTFSPTATELLASAVFGFGSYPVFQLGSGYSDMDFRKSVGDNVDQNQKRIGATALSHLAGMIVGSALVARCKWLHGVPK